jgi:hypothetical protein
MGQHISFDWRTVGDHDWSALPPAEPLPPARDRQFVQRFAGEDLTSRHLLRFALFLCLAWLVAGASGRGSPLSAHEVVSPSLEQTILPVLQREAIAWRTDDAVALDEIIDAQVAENWRLDWRAPYVIDPQFFPDRNEKLLGVKAAGEMVVVTMLVDAPVVGRWRSSPYRELRFYRQQGQDWVRTLPASDFWGREMTLETPHLRVSFSERDANTVLAILDQLELVYVQLHDLLHLELPATEDKLAFRIVPELVRGWGSYGNTQRLTSPILAKVPDGMTSTDYLAQTMVGRFTSLLINQIVVEQDGVYTYSWRTLLWALDGWLRNELLARRSPWHYQAEETLRRRQHETLPLHLTDVVEQPINDPYDQHTMMRQYIVAESALAYAMHTFGRERLPALLAGLHHHGSWSGLIRGVFGVAPEEFERGWNQFVEEHYLAP